MEKISEGKAGPRNWSGQIQQREIWLGRIVETRNTLESKCEMPECFLCNAEGDTREHVPSKAFFDNVPENIITVPACTNCNGSFAKDEEYFRTVVVAQCYGTSPEARRVWAGPIIRSLWRRGYEGLRKRLVGHLITVEIWNEEKQHLANLPGVAVEGGRAARVVRKIIRGLYLSIRNEKLADGDLIIFRDGDVRLDPEQLTRGWTGIDMGEAFRFRYHFDDYGGGIWIEFYRSQWWLALAGRRLTTTRDRRESGSD
jgi:hypothetical protein